MSLSGEAGEELRVGVLGAARIVPSAMIAPAREVAGVRVVAVAARDRGRAEGFAAKHGIPVVHGGYQDVIDDPDVDAVYVPLPNGLHAEWTLRAIAAGKHVLCEKPFTANAEEARRVAEAAKAAEGVVVMEAFHYRYHPLAERMRQIVAGESELGSLGTIRHIETALCFPLVKRSDIRYRLDLAGGAMMDAGCYALHAARLLGGEPAVVGAKAELRSEQVDRKMTARLEFPGGATGTVTASLWSRSVLAVRARVVGERGRMSVLNFVAPQVFHRVTTVVDGRRHREKVAGDASYTHQLRAFRAAVGGDAAANLTTPEDAVVTMRLIDDVYRAAGLRPRGLAE